MSEINVWSNMMSNYDLLSAENPMAELRGKSVDGLATTSFGCSCRIHLFFEDSVLRGKGRG